MTEKREKAEDSEGRCSHWRLQPVSAGKLILGDRSRNSVNCVIKVLKRRCYGVNLLDPEHYFV